MFINISLLQFTMDAQAYINGKSNCVNALYSAIMDERVDVIKYLSSKKIMLKNIPNSDIEPFLLIEPNIRKEFIDCYFGCCGNDKKSEYIEYLDYNEIHLLTIAVEHGKKKIIDYIFNCKKCVNNMKQDDIMKIIDREIHCNRLELVHYFLEKRYVHDYYVIKKIVKNNYIHAIDLLIKINGNERAFYYSVKYDNLEFTEILILKKVKISRNFAEDILNSNFSNNNKTKSVFLSYLLDEDNKITINGDFIKKIVNYCRNLDEYSEIIKQFIDKCENINEDSDKILQHLAFYGNWTLVKYLIDIGANVHAKNGQVLMEAIVKDDFAMVKYLTDLGINIYANDDQFFNYCHVNEKTQMMKHILSLYPKQDIKRLIKYRLNDICSLLVKTDLSNMDNIVEVLREFGIDIYDMVEKEYNYFLLIKFY